MLVIFVSEDHTVVEPLAVPEGSKAGDRIYVEGNQGTPDEQLNPKKKVRFFYLERTGHIICRRYILGIAAV